MRIRFYTNHKKFTKAHRLRVIKNIPHISPSLLSSLYYYTLGSYIPESGMIRISLQNIAVPYKSATGKVKFNYPEDYIIKRTIKTVVHEVLHGAIIDAGFDWNPENNNKHEILVEEITDILELEG